MYASLAIRLVSSGVMLGIALALTLISHSSFFLMQPCLVSPGEVLVRHQRAAPTARAPSLVSSKCPPAPPTPGFRGARSHKRARPVLAASSALFQRQESFAGCREL